MDFVVVGFGLGALAILLGVILRGWLAGRCERAAARAADPIVAAYERANAAECRGAGQAFLAAGGAVVLATVGGLAGALDDRSGALLVTTTATVAALGIILWGYLYRSRNPLPPRPRRHKPLATMAGASEVASDFAASARPGGALVWATPSGEPGSAEAGRFEQTPTAETSGDSGDGEDRNGVLAGEMERPLQAALTSPLENSDSPEANVSPDVVALASAEATVPDVGAAANGHLAGDEVGADDTKVVAFAARKTGAGMHESAVADDDAVDD